MLTGKIIPLFNKYPVIGGKGVKFLDFCKIAELIKSKEHLAPAGLQKVKKIKEGINTGRS
jgi:hypothetical protein